jgi:hypothetical protein
MFIVGEWLELKRAKNSGKEQQGQAAGRRDYALLPRY